MKSNGFGPVVSTLRRPRTLRWALCALLVLPLGLVGVEPDAKDAATLWREVVKAGKPPVPPEAWREKEPSKAEADAFKLEQAKKAVAAADKAKEFLARFPDDPHAGEARQKYVTMLKIAGQLGDASHAGELATAQKQDEKEHPASEDEKFTARFKEIQQAAMAKNDEGKKAVFAEYEKGIRALLKDYPGRAELLDGLLVVAFNSDKAKGRAIATEILSAKVSEDIKVQAKVLLAKLDMNPSAIRELLKEHPDHQELYMYLLQIALNGPADKAKALAAEILESKAPEEIKMRAKDALSKLELVGKPIDIKYQAVDGREVDVSRLKGKVVLIDFWATWCGPCVAELPNVKAVYDKQHEKGFEIVGISLDETKSALDKFVAAQNMAWPQFFDGNGWHNKFAAQFGVQAVPAMWLVDKKGLVRDIDATDGLGEKVEKLLLE